MGVPLEWNVVVVYSALRALLGAPRRLDPVAIGPPAARGLARRDARGGAAPRQPLARRASRSSWRCATTPATGRTPIWLFRGEAYRKLERLTTSSPWVYDQLARFYDRGDGRGARRQGDGLPPDAPARPRAASARAEGRRAPRGPRVDRRRDRRRAWRSAGTSATGTCTRSSCSRRSRRSAASRPGSCGASSSSRSRSGARRSPTGSSTRRRASSSGASCPSRSCAHGSRGSAPRERRRCRRRRLGAERARGGHRARAGGRVGARARGRKHESEAARAPRSSRCPASATTCAPRATRWASCRPSSARCRSREHGLRWVQPPVSVAHPLDDQPAVLLQALRSGDGAGARRRCRSLRAARRAVPARSARPAGRPPRAAAVFRATRCACCASASTPSGRRRAWRAGDSVGSARGRSSRGARPTPSCRSSAPRRRRWGCSSACRGTSRTGRWRREGRRRSRARSRACSRRSAAASRHGAPSRTLADLPPARGRTSSTRAPRSSRRSPSPCSRGISAAPAAGTATGRASSRSTGRSTARSRGGTDAVAEASTVHLGGTLDEIAASEARRVARRAPGAARSCCSSSRARSTRRAPRRASTRGTRTVTCPRDRPWTSRRSSSARSSASPRAFGDRVLARHVMNTADLERYNPSLVGGAITGGVADLGQLFTRPVARWNPYTTPHPRIFLCSAATPPGGGVHGMCGLPRRARSPPAHRAAAAHESLTVSPPGRRRRSRPPSPTPSAAGPAPRHAAGGASRRRSSRGPRRRRRAGAGCGFRS